MLQPQVCNLGFDKGQIIDRWEFLFSEKHPKNLKFLTREGWVGGNLDLPIAHLWLQQLMPWMEWHHPEKCNWIEDVIPKMPYDSISSSSVRSAQSLKVDSRPPWSSNIKETKGLLHSDIIMRTDCLLQFFTIVNSQVYFWELYVSPDYHKSCCKYQMSR